MCVSHASWTLRGKTDGRDDIGKVRTEKTGRHRRWRAKDKGDGCKGVPFEILGVKAKGEARGALVKHL
jgi:hypothetical protein